MWAMIKYQSIRTILLCNIRSNLFHYSKQPVCYQYWTNPRSNRHLVSIVRLESLSFVNVQYVIVGSLVIIMTTWSKWMVDWLINTTILIQEHCKNGKENSIIRQAGLIFWKNRIINCYHESVWNKQTNKQAIEMLLIND